MPFTERIFFDNLFLNFFNLVFGVFINESHQIKSFVNMRQSEQNILLDYESVHLERKSNALITPIIDNKIPIQTSTDTPSVELPNLIDDRKEFQEEKIPLCQNIPPQGMKIVKIHQLLPKTFYHKRQINLFECKNRQVSKSKKKLNLSLTSQNKSQQKPPKSGLKLNIAKNDSMMRIHSFKLLQLEEKKRTEIKSSSKLNQKKLKQVLKIREDLNQKPQKKKIKLHKLRA